MMPNTAALFSRPDGTILPVSPPRAPKGEVIQVTGVRDDAAGSRWTGEKLDYADATEALMALRDQARKRNQS